MKYLKSRLRLELNSRWLIEIIVTSAPFILLSPVIFTGKIMFWGTGILQFLPWQHLAWEMIHSGEIPLWNPYVGMGAPLLANYQTAVFYPPNWFLFLLDAVGGIGWMGWGHAVLVAGHLLWAIWGMRKLIKSFGIGDVGQVIGGLSFGLCGYLVDRAGFFSINSVVVWLPWILYYCVPAMENKSGQKILDRRLLKLSISMAMLLLGGHAQTAGYILVLGAIWTIALPGITAHSQIYLGTTGQYTPQSRKYFRVYLSALTRYSAALAFAVLITSVQLLPTFEYLLNSQRASMVPVEQAMTYSFWPWRIITLIAPDFFGSPVSGNYWGYGNYWEDALYFGILPFFAVMGAILWRGSKNDHDDTKVVEKRRYRRLIWFAVGCILISLLLALGKNTPIFPFLYHNIPGFDMFQAPTRFSIWAEFGFALLAGIGMDRWRKPRGRCLYWSRLGVAGAGAITIGTGLAWYAFGEIAETMLKATAIAGFLGMVTTIIYLTTPMQYEGSFLSLERGNSGFQKGQVWGGSLIFFVSLDLLVAGWGMNPAAPQDLLTAQVESVKYVREFVGSGRLYLPSDDEYYLKYTRFMRFDTFNPSEDWMDLRSILLPDINMIDHVRSVNNYDPMIPSRYDAWMKVLDDKWNPESVSEYRNLMNLSGIRVVEYKDNSEQSGVNYSMLEGSTNLRFVPCPVSVKNGAEALNWFRSNRIEPGKEVVIEVRENESYPTCDESNTLEPVDVGLRVKNENYSSMEVEVENPQSGFLVISNTWYPGWVAKVNGKPVEILRANYLFQAVSLEPGRSDVRIEYDSRTFITGSMCTFLGLFVLAGLVFYSNKQR